MSKKKIQNDVLVKRLILADNASSLMAYLPNPDEVLTNSGEALSIYRDMKVDGRVKSLLKLARGQITKWPIHLEQGEALPKVEEFVRTAISQVPLEKVVRRLLPAVDFGFSVAEVVWQNKDGWWYPEDVIGKKPDRFLFDKDGLLSLKDKNDLIPLSGYDYKFLLFRHDKEPENPYGTSLLKSAYWPWKFKKAGLGFWLTATEKFAVPTILALFDSQEGEEKVKARAQALGEMLSSINSGSTASVANVKDIRTITTAGDLADFRALIDWCDTQIAYALTGQSLATGEAEFGSRAQSEIHQDTMEDTARAAITDLTEVLQRFIDWIVELNFGPDIASPQIFFDTANHASWDMVRDALDRGFPVSKSALYDRYGLPRPKDEEDAFLSPNPQQPAGQDLFMADEPVKKNGFRKRLF